jgi:hypothetical protein
VQKYGALYKSSGKWKRNFYRKANASDAFTDFLECAKELASDVANTIFTDHVVYNFEERESILKLLYEHISGNLIKVSFFH